MAGLGEVFNPRRKIDNLRFVNDTILLAESEEELKSLLIMVKEESEKAGLKLILYPYHRYMCVYVYTHTYICTYIS